jgi:hypothetical protein
VSLFLLEGSSARVLYVDSCFLEDSVYSAKLQRADLLLVVVANVLKDLSVFILGVNESKKTVATHFAHVFLMILRKLTLIFFHRRRYCCL